MVADSNAERQRRYRAHTSGDHRLCKPENCPQAGQGPPPEPVWPSGAELPDTVEKAMLGDIEALGELFGIEGSLAAIALKLGRAIDDANDPRELAALSREARSTLTDLTASVHPPTRVPATAGQPRPAGPGSEVNGDDGWSGMDMPVGAVRAAV